MNDPKRDLQREAEAAAHLRMELADTIEHDDDALWHDVVEGQCDLLETFDRVLEAIGQDEADAKALGARIAQHQSRKTRLEHRVERGKKAVRDALQMAGLPRARRPLATISFGKTQRVDIVNSERLPAEFWRQPPPTPDKEAIKAKLKKGEDVPGAELTETQGVRITWT